MKFRSIIPILFLIFISCDKDEIVSDVDSTVLPYSVSGRVVDHLGTGIEGVEIFHNPNESIFTDSQGNWAFSDLEGPLVIRANASAFTFLPLAHEVSSGNNQLIFTGTRILSETETQIYNWFGSQQLPNGLLESSENSNFVSLYDNALASMVFMLRADFAKAERIFNFFNTRIDSELKNGVGGFSQFRNANGSPNNHRWMGDNAWLLIALNNYKALTGRTTYDNLAQEITNWLVDLQDTDGGLFAGYNPDNSLMNHKVTEGNIDAFNAVAGYTNFHSQLLNFLENERWHAVDRNLVAWPENPPYLYAMDLHPWSYLIFENYPISSLTSAGRYVNTQTAANGMQVTGYCFDVDKDAVWSEGTGQMAVAFGFANMDDQKEFYLDEMESILIESTSHSNASGLPYASNLGTAYGSDPLWVGANTEISISGGAWYFFAKFNFNPFGVNRLKNIPTVDKFWIL